MSVTLQDIENQVRDYVSTYGTGQFDKQIIWRQINRSIEFLKRKIGIPSDENIQTILFCEDQIYYDTNLDLDEAFMLVYHDPRYNLTSRRFDYFMYPDLLQRTGQHNTNKFSFTTINGRKQLMILGSNIRSSYTINTLSSLTDITATGDASSLSLDTFIKYTGDSSIKFDITNSFGVAGIKLSNQNLDLEQLFRSNGIIKVWNYITDNNIDDMVLYLKTNDSNYYTITATELDNGDDFTANEWTKVGFNVNDAVAIGIPDINNITEIVIEYDLGAGFTSAVDFRLNYLFAVYPDEMDLLYYTNIKGTDTTGVTNKPILDMATDKVAFGEMFPDYIDLVAMQASIRLYPQLKGDKDFYAALTNDMKEWIKTMTRTYPRKRLQGQYSHYLRRK